MSFSLATARARAHTHWQERRTALVERAWLLALFGFTALVGLLLIRRGATWGTIAWLIYLFCSAAVVYRPRYGIYLIIALGLAGDGKHAPWWPFVKNFSSRESIFYVADAVIVSPLEVTLVLTTIAWLGPRLFQRSFKLVTGPLFWPAIAFAAFITFGLAYGLATGGNLNIALWAVRGIYVLPLMIILVSNLIETRRHVNHVVWAAIFGISVNSIFGFSYVANELKFDWSTVPSIAEHAFSIHVNALFVLLAGVIIYRGSATRRVVLLLMLPFLLTSYLANQRRAAFVALGVALIIVGIVMFWQNRRLFMRIVPPAAIVLTLYVGAFWNGGGGPIGAPVWKLRTAIAPPPGSEEESSNIYRVLENINTMFTIKTSPLMGVGFGNKFYSIVPLPDISFFIWYEYFTHNSILWIWMQAGIGGFLALLFLIGMALATGTQTLIRMPQNDLSAVALMALTYVAMHFVFAYVDMSWDSESMLFVGAMMGLLNVLQRIVAQPVPLPTTRWPWQQPPTPPEGLQLP